MPHKSLPKAERQNEKLFVAANAAWDRGNLRDAFDLFLSAAEAGDASCQLNIGYFFDRGHHIRKDKKMAMHWYHQAYRQGEAAAANNIAILHRESGSIHRMIWWYRRAVAMGNHDPLLELGKCYEAGQGLPKCARRAAECYRHIMNSHRVTEFTRKQAKRRLEKLTKKQAH